jgi:phospholipid/cholesterol/gamma-HCH transport system permease protein
MSAPCALILKEAHYRDCAPEPAEPAGARTDPVIDLVADLGQGVVQVGADVISGISFFGRIMATLGLVLARRTRLRPTSIVFHLEHFGLRALPIVILINFLIGGIVAQQSLFQLRRFGASTFAVDLVGILVLRELAVLLTSIIMAGRSASAITAELGSMNMREEISALQVMGLDPVHVLVVPRLIALVIALPLLTFIGDLAALGGGLLVSWLYAGVSPVTFLVRLKNAIVMGTFMTGMLKAPVMAFVMGVIAAIEGLSVSGSAESLGRHVTSAVVKSIFMVIFLDGLFAIFFAAIRY